LILAQLFFASRTWMRRRDVPRERGLPAGTASMADD